tara:strand:- start:1408 stop:2652 length:1245 start_codon:yes stop_codon:yes gene_type:complete
MNFNNGRDEIFNLNRNNFNDNNTFKSNNNFSGGLRAGDDSILNKKKISEDIISSSGASSSSGSVSSLSDTSSESSVASSYKKKKSRSRDTDSSASSSASDSSNSNASSSTSSTVSRKKSNSMVDSVREKKEIIYQLDRLEQRGYKIPFKFNLNSDIEEMRLEYNKLLKEKEIDNSIRFQRKMLMAFTTGTEYLNNRYDPFAIQLDGWSEQIHDNITDYDDIFEELHDKYKSTGKKMAPELRLFISLSGSAFMFHLTNRMFKEQPLPNIENVLKSNPDLMKQFQQAAAKEYVMPSNNNNDISYNNNNSHFNNPNNGPGLFGMVSGLFNNLGGGPMRDNNINNNNINFNDDDSISEIDSIIDDVHKNISIDEINVNNNNIETLSVSDEEITSIIEDNADIKLLNKNKNKNKRSLNI